MINTVANKYQNLSEQFPHLIADLPTVCFEAFNKVDPDETLILLVYEARYLRTLQVGASNPASTFSLHDMEKRTRGIIKRIVTLHPQRHKLEFTRQHYAHVGWRSFFANLYVDRQR